MCAAVRLMAGLRFNMPVFGNKTLLKKFLKFFEKVCKKRLTFLQVCDRIIFALRKQRKACALSSVGRAVDS